jgi:V-type H+-transporting ATPase 16kDa proteolipid subunit
LYLIASLPFTLLSNCTQPSLAAARAQIYGLVVSVLISGDLKSPMALYTGFIQLGAGLSVGLAGLSAGFAIGIVGDAGVRGVAQQVSWSSASLF